MKSMVMCMIVCLSCLIMMFSNVKGKVSNQTGTLENTQLNNFIINKRRPSLGYASPPFARLLKTARERMELLNLIKDARRRGVAHDQLHCQIHRFLRDHLNDVDYNEVQLLRQEGRKLNPDLLDRTHTSTCHPFKK
ncbi:hypothetical protein DICVIV_05329 [Dictyocaulus viviparus]|uniref:Uncharacterized protein n=1 Tax=Dictyocaulus viviparus TaxID=29172 RepID=A0A0D8XV73_DICVI|nr:hypothetical protein DICVIV_05329 [Dictyocaulus viviparus]